MRNFSISNLFASVVTRVIDVVAVAGIATRSFLHLTSMRGYMGNRFEQCQQETLGQLLQAGLLLGNLLPGNKRLALLQPAYALAYGNAAQTVCPAPRLSQSRASWRG